MLHYNQISPEWLRWNDTMMNQTAFFQRQPFLEPANLRVISFLLSCSHPLIDPFQIASRLGDLEAAASKLVWCYPNLSQGQCILIRAGGRGFPCTALTGAYLSYFFLLSQNFKIGLNYSRWYPSISHGCKVGRHKYHYRGLFDQYFFSPHSVYV